MAKNSTSSHTSASSDPSNTITPDTSRDNSNSGPPKPVLTSEECKKILQKTQARQKPGNACPCLPPFEPADGKKTNARLAAYKEGEKRIKQINRTYRTELRAVSAESVVKAKMKKQKEAGDEEDCRSRVKLTETAPETAQVRAWKPYYANCRNKGFQFDPFVQVCKGCVKPPSCLWEKLEKKPACERGPNSWAQDIRVEWTWEKAERKEFRGLPEWEEFDFEENLDLAPDEVASGKESKTFVPFCDRRRDAEAEAEAMTEPVTPSKSPMQWLKSRKTWS